MSFNINLFTPGDSAADSPAAAARRLLAFGVGAIICPGCSGEVAPVEEESGWQTCPYCQRPLQIRVWGSVQQNTNASAALSDQATCFFHPDKAFQACCQRCGRFVCALCDLQLGAEHVCPTCFESGRANSVAGAGTAEWRHRDVLYDSIAVTIGWGWILFWPVFIAAFPAAIFLHVKYRKAPRSYLIPRRGWRFWMAYPGLLWLPLLLSASFIVRWMLRRHF
ncbi:MAG TPA: hypothetical protein VK805_10805 [Candidatus Baltobacteraceae bacterium]|nr:hypothetical protein [Candidatus Baltobacteraceae bacterium]